MALSEITPSAVKIDKLISRVADGDIKIPAFQRHFVWKQEQVIELLDSIYKDFPIGSILLWNSNEKLKATRNICGLAIPDRAASYPLNYVLDGQQRLSTIYAVFCTDRTRETDIDEQVGLAVFDIYFDLKTLSFRPASELVQGNTSFPLKHLFNITEYVKSLKNLTEPEQLSVQTLHSKFNNYEVPIVTITKRSKSEVGTIFERINSTGTKLTTLDLMIAWTWKEDFHLKDEIQDLLDNLDTKSFGDLPEKIVLQCLSAVVSKSTSTKSILDLNPDAVHKNFELLTASLEKTVDFLSTQLNAYSDFLPHVQQIVPITYFFSKTESPTSNQTRWIKKWFWYTSFSRRYAAQTDEKMDTDLELFDNFLNDKADGLEKYEYTIKTQDLIDQKFSKSSPLVRAFLLLAAQNSPMDLVNGSMVDLGRALSSYNSKEFHHIFPKAFLKKRGITSAKINSMVNFCFLTADSNKKISDKQPDHYFFNIIPEDKFSQIL